MLRLELLGLSSRETRRLPADEINAKVNRGGFHGIPDLPLELREISESPNGKFVIYYGGPDHGELPPNHKNKPGEFTPDTFWLVYVDIRTETILDEGVVEKKIRPETELNRHCLHFTAKCELLGRFEFYCS